MINHKRPYQGAIQRYKLKFSVTKCNINLSLKGLTDIQLTSDEERIINALRGLLGKKAKLAMFKIFIESGKYTFEELITAFPSYVP